MLTRMVRSISNGYAEHGHLYGAHVTVVSIDASDNGESPIHLPDTIEPGTHAHLFLAGRGTDALMESAHASIIAEKYRAAGARVTACIRPGVHLGARWLAYESVLRITEADFHEVSMSEIDEEIGSISVHFWPGSGMLTLLAGRTRAPYGRFLVLGRDDIGEAKVWLKHDAAMAAKWRIIPSYPMNDLEGAEIEDMFHTPLR